MNLGRAACAHVCSVLLGSLLILIGVETIMLGQTGPIVGLAKWIGGALVFGILSLMTLPIGLSMRWLVGKLPLEPLVGALTAGGSVGFALIFVLHPGLYPSMSISTHPVELFGVHVLSGLLCGWLWHVIEFRPSKALVHE